MKVELQVSRCGPGLVQNAGDVVEVGTEEGKRLIEAGQAIPVREEKVEKAVSKRKAEKASK